MSVFTKPAQAVFAGYNEDGSPRQIQPDEAQVWGTELERLVNAFLAGGGLIYATRAALEADLDRDVNTMAWVMGDPLAANNGVYRKVGASGAGSWVRAGDLPYSFIVASDVGLGTANAIQITSATPVSDTAVVVFSLFEATTGSPVMVSINGGAALTLKTNRGGNASALSAGMEIWGRVRSSDNTFRLLNDQDVSALVAQAEAAQAAAEAAAASARPTLKSLGGDDTGVADSSAILASACSTYKHVVVPKGAYRIGANITIPSDASVKFEDGGMLVVDPSVVITWNGGIVAGVYQQIFSGILTHTSYTRIGDIPYTFALQGNPKIEWSSPLWFGAKGDGVTDDIVALYCAQYFGGNMYLPTGTYIASNQLQLRVDGQRIFGEGLTSIVMGDGSVDNGATVSFRGQPPTTAAGTPAKFMVGGIIENIHIDGADAQNQNGLGGSFCRDCKIFNNFFSNVGRKAITWQYHVQGCIDYGNTIYESNQEPSSTTAAISLEGQPAGLNYTNDGGVNGTSDLAGLDVFGNVSGPNVVYASGHGYVTLQRCIGNEVILAQAGDTSSTGSHIILAVGAKKNRVSILKAGNTSRRFIFCDAGSEDNVISGDFGDNVGSIADGYAVHDRGARNEFIDVKFDHSNTSTTSSRTVFLEGTDAVIERMHIRSTDCTTGVAASSAAARLKVLHSRFNTASARTMLLGGDDALVEGNYCDAGSATTGIQVQGARPIVKGNRITGAATNRVLVDGTTAAPYAVVTENVLDSAPAQINFSSNTLFTSVKCNNPGDSNSGDNILLGGSTVWVDSTGKLRVLSTGVRTSDTDGVVVGTQT